MTKTTEIPADVRTRILDEAGQSADGPTAKALDLWEAGDREGAVLAMWRDGADADWIDRFTGLLGCGPLETDRLVGHCQAWSEW